MDESIFLEEIRNWEHPPWHGNTQFEEKVKEIFLVSRKGLHLHQLKTHFRMPVKRQMTSGPCQETSHTAITLNPESNFTRREKNHSLFHWFFLTSPELHIQTWMLCKKAATMTIGISMDQEIFLLLGQVSLSLLYWKRNLQTDFCGPGRDWQNGKRHPGQIIHGQNSGEECQRTLSWGRSIYGQLKNQSSIMQEDCEESISLTLRIWSSRKSLRMQEKNLETPMAPAMPCKTCKKNKHGETRCKTHDFRSKWACILEASESTRMRTEESLQKYNEDHVAGKGDNSLQH